VLGLFLVVVARAYLWPAAPHIDRAMAQSLGAIADKLWSSRSTEDYPEHIESWNWPAEIRGLTPKSVWLTRDGLYIKLGEMFVRAWGLFILPSASTFHPPEKGDPSYRQLEGRVYWFRIEG